MALTSQQIADILFKKVATGKADSGSLPFAFFEESVNSNKSTITKDYWVDASLIPNINPLTSGTHGQTLGVVKAIKTLLLDWIPGTFAFTHPTLKDVIPFNYGNGSYNYQLLLNDGTTDIPAGTNDWYLDTEGGVLTFFNGGSPAFPSGVNSTTLIPKLTCWTYIGAKNNPVLTLTESSSGSIADTYVLNSDLRFYAPNIVYVIKIANTNTSVSTLNINSLGAKNIKKNNDGILVDVEADDLKAGINYIFIYDLENDIFQVASDVGSGTSLKIIDINSTDWVLNGDYYEYIIPNYTILGFKEVGSVGLWSQISGNDFELVSVDFEINRFTKELIVKSLTNTVSHLRIMGGGKVNGISNGSVVGYLDDLSDVTINNITLNEGNILSFNGSAWVNIPSIIETTFSNLVTLQNSSSLIPYTYYKFSHQTKHIIPNTSVLNIGTSEDIIVKAISTTQLHKVVISDQYLNDIIHYDFNDRLCEDGTTIREGKITFRHDTSINISTHYDFRNVKFRRWESASGIGDYKSVSDTTFGYTDYYTFKNLQTPTITDVNNITIGKSISYNYNNNLLENGNIITSNIYFSDNCHENNIGTGSNNNTFGMGCNNNIIKGNDNKLENSCAFIEMTQVCNGNYFCSGIQNVDFNGTITNCKFLITTTSWNGGVINNSYTNIVVDMKDSNNVHYYRSVDNSGIMSTNILS